MRVIHSETALFSILIGSRANFSFTTVFVGD